MAKRRRQIPESQKIALRKHYHDNPHLKQAELIQWFKIIFNEDISQGQISQFLSNIYSHLDNDDLSQSHASK